MAVKTKRSYGGSRKSRRNPFLRIRIPAIFLERHLLPGWILVAVVVLLLLPNILIGTASVAGNVIRSVPSAVAGIPRWFGGLFAAPSSIAPLFTSEVEHWSGDISRWAAEYELDPNLIATVMQIESCGHPTVSSYAGAQGLFQVMPFHFLTGENQLDPNTNAMRGMNFLNQCIDYADGDFGLAMACYNGGPSMTSRPFADWPEQTQRYYNWGTGIYRDAAQNANSSETITRWLDAGGINLCNQAAGVLGIQ